jgi:hypothetical protein
MALVVDGGGLVNKGGALGTGQECCCGGPPCPHPPIGTECDDSRCRPGDCPDGCFCFEYVPAVLAPPDGPGCFPGEEFNPPSEEFLGFCRPRCNLGNCNTLGDEFADNPCNNNCPDGYNCCDGTCYPVPCDTVYTTNACFGTVTCCDCDTPCPEGCECVEGICKEEEAP